MAVKLTSGGKLLFPLTSPPSKPKPAPAKGLVAKVVSYGDREIVVTIPFPDTVELVADIVNDMSSNPDHSGKPVKAIYAEMDNEIQKWLVEVKMGLPASMSGTVNAGSTKAEFFIPYDEVQPLNRARLTVWRQQKTDFGAWKVKLEFSPSKAGPAGLVKLISAMETGLPYLNVAKLLGGFRVARLDAAVDCIGASPLDLIAHVPKPGKRMVYVGSHGRPESVYFYEAKKPLTEPPKKLGVKTTGAHRLTLYERRDYHLQLLLKPPYGKCPVTRAEVSKRWKKGRPQFSELSSVANLFVGRRLAYAPAVAGVGGRDWRQFCLAAFGAGVNGALSSWFPGPGFKLAKAYSDCLGDLVDQACWEGWQDGIDITGLAEWIKIAQGSG